MKKILSRVFAAWALIVFIITMLPVALLMWMIGTIKEPKRTNYFRIISKIWMRIFFFLTGCSLKIKGINNFKPGEKYIVICNHNSLMDVPLSTPFIPGANKTIAKAEMAKIPIFGLIYKRGSILVDRNDKNSRKNSFKKMKEVLNLGMHMCVYPEGTRNKTEMPIKEFHDGAFKLAVETETNILPALMFNTKKVLPPGQAFYFWPTKMELHFLPPVTISKSDDVELVKQNLHKIMSEYYINQLKKLP
ncbi:1-acyl-sn-glycerol-3-phosphate acyltransferase [Ginsengibacter hankyongi]|uniref:1-acyl-sn-glycerol-3-phosphate acyltransferase n=1 Tax=Ginsengibacter hankyongi TaxID=2607284 RepID=A0A5J5IDZ8_9BACT|nr:lysophospholipid acyltransferase family protein [Ginsengibacter hankyongi]KAA9036607.1 1-acyl-sn-glycerol-3-phosphate acyltransferase [Ginsengibacter hankyongi]